MAVRANLGFGTLPFMPDPAALMASGTQPEKPPVSDLANNAGSLLSAIGLALLSSPRNAPLSNLGNILPGMMEAQQKRDQQRRVFDFARQSLMDAPPNPAMLEESAEAATPMAGMPGNAGTAGDAGPVPAAPIADATAPAAYAPLIQQAAANSGIPPETLTRLISTESRFRPDAVGPPTKYGRAQGIAQFMPATAERFNIDPLVPEQAIPAAARYVAANRDMFGGNMGLALAGYNWGEGNVQEWLADGAQPARMPAETRNYVQAITGRPIEAWTGGGAASPPQPSVPATNLRSDFNSLARDGMLPPGVRVNSAGLPYSATVTSMSPTERANVEASMAALSGRGFVPAASDAPDEGTAVVPPAQGSPLQYAQAQPVVAADATPSPRTIAQARATMPNGAPPPRPDAVSGRTTQRAMAARSVQYWSRVMIAAGMLGEAGRGIVEAAKANIDLAKGYMTPTDIQKNVEAAFPGNPAAQQQALRNAMTDNSPEHAAAVTRANKEAELETAPEFEDIRVRGAIRQAEGTPTGTMKESRVFLRGTPEEQEALTRAGALSRPQTTINNVTNPIAAGIGKSFVEQRDRAASAADSIRAIHLARDQVNAGIISGPGADYRVFLQRVGELFGLPADTAANTAAFQSAIGEQVLSTVKQLGAGVSISNADRDFAERMAAGKIELGEASLRRALDIRESIARQIIANYNRQSERLMQGSPDDTIKAISPLLMVQPPGDYQRQAAPAQSPGGSASSPQRRYIWTPNGIVPAQ